MKKLENYMFYILMSIYLPLFLLQPYFVPRYLSLNGFLLSWLLFTSITSVTIKLIWRYLEKKNNQKA